MATTDVQQIDGSLAGYMCHTVEHLAELNNVVNQLRWEMHCGHPDFMLNYMRRTKKSLRELKNDLEMVEHCLKYRPRDVAKLKVVP